MYNRVVDLRNFSTLDELINKELVYLERYTNIPEEVIVRIRIKIGDKYIDNDV